MRVSGPSKQVLNKYKYKQTTRTRTFFLSTSIGESRGAFGLSVCFFQKGKRTPLERQTPTSTPTRGVIVDPGARQRAKTRVFVQGIFIPSAVPPGYAKRENPHPERKLLSRFTESSLSGPSGNQHQIRKRLIFRAPG